MPATQGHDMTAATNARLEDRAAVGVALALWAQSEGQRAVRELESEGIRVLMLKGPDLQRRLYGTPAAYRSGDVDVLVPRRSGRRARRNLARNGWAFSAGNGFLWR